MKLRGNVSQEVRVMLMCRFAWAIGLECPSEGTLLRLTAIVFFTGTDQDPVDVPPFDESQDVKSRLH